MVVNLQKVVIYRSYLRNVVYSELLEKETSLYTALTRYVPVGSGNISVIPRPKIAILNLKKYHFVMPNMISNNTTMSLS